MQVVSEVDSEGCDCKCVYHIRGVPCRSECEVLCAWCGCACKWRETFKKSTKNTLRPCKICRKTFPLQDMISIARPYINIYNEEVPGKYLTVAYCMECYDNRYPPDVKQPEE